MAKNQSAGLLLYRYKNILEVFLVHPGGPLWKNKDETAWSIPKGEFDENEDPLQAAIREFLEETGIPVSGEFIELKPVIQKGGKKFLPGLLKKILMPLLYNQTILKWNGHPGRANIKAFLK